MESYGEKGRLTLQIVSFVTLSLHSLGTSNVFVSSSSQNTVVLNIMYVSLLCVTLFDMVLYCLACQVLSCINFVVTVTVTDGQ